MSQPEFSQPTDQSSGIVIPERIRHITTIVDGKLSIDLPSFKGKLFDDAWVGIHSRTHLQLRVPVEERELPLPENVFVLSKEGSYISDYDMNEITLINSNNSPDDINARYEYQENLFKVFKDLAEELILWPEYKFNPDNAVFFAPQRGADLIQAYFQHLGVISNPENIVDYELKREYLPDGTPVVGRIDTYYPEGEFETGVFIDDCLASDASASASIKIMKEKYPSLKNIIIVVSAATRRGLEELAKKNPDIKIIAATEVYAMNDHFYLLRTPEEVDNNGNPYPSDKVVFYVGDMGAWAEPLPEEKNIDAPWNRFRS